MLLIVAHHYVVNSGLMDVDGPIYASPLSIKSLFLLLFGMWGKTGINCFVLITGYFMCTSKITVKKYAKLLLEIYFYRVIFYAVFLATGYTPFNVVSLLKVVLPVYNLSDNFIGCFLVFYLTIPFLTILVRNMTEKQHLLLLALCMFAYVIIGSIPRMGISFNYVSWFGVLFFIASYIRIYPKEWFDRQTLWSCLMTASILISMLSVLGMTWISTKLGLSGVFYWFVADSNKIFAVATSVTSFVFFRNLKLKHSRVINTIAASTFAVLLIHANSDAMRQWLWKDTLNNVAAYNTNYLYLHAILSVVGVFAICVLIDQIRIRFIEKPIMGKLSNYEWFK
jgi:hypothetical protein